MQVLRARQECAFSVRCVHRQGKPYVGAEVERATRCKFCARGARSQRKKSTAGALRVEAKAFLAIDINGTPEETIENMAAKLSAKFAAMCESDPKLAKEIVDFDIAAKMKEYKKAKRHADSEAAATLTDAAPDSRGRATKRSAESTAAAHRPVRARRVERPSL